LHVLAAPTAEQIEAGLGEAAPEAAEEGGEAEEAPAEAAAPEAE
jgi:hypothetical protein